MKHLSPSETSAFVRALCDAMQDIVFFKNPDGQYLFANHAFERLYGYTFEQLAGKSDFDFLSEDEARFFAERDREAMESGKPMVSEAWQHNELTDQRECYRTTKLAVYSDEGQLLGIVGVVKDVTQQKAAEALVYLESPASEGP